MGNKKQVKIWRQQLFDGTIDYANPKEVEEWFRSIQQPYDTQYYHSGDFQKGRINQLKSNVYKKCILRSRTYECQSCELPLSGSIHLEAETRFPYIKYLTDSTTKLFE